MPDYPSRQRFPVKLVNGYIYPVDTLPAEISFSKSPGRLALAFNTYYPEVEGDFFLDYELILTCLDPILQMGQLTVMDEQNSPVEFEKLKASWVEDEDRDWFRQIIVKDQGLVLFQIFGQPWFRVGGPEPYHDTATVEIYMGRDRIEEVAKLLIDAISEAGVNTQLVSGTRLPLRERWWRGLFKG